MFPTFTILPTGICNFEFHCHYPSWYLRWTHNNKKTWASLISSWTFTLTASKEAGYELLHELLRLITSHGWLQFPRLDTNCGWFYPVADSSPDDELQLILSCGWLRVAADSILRVTGFPQAGLDLKLTYTLICLVSLRTYSAKYIIFMVGFLPANFSYYWFRLWVLLQEPWRSLKKLQDPSCDWF